MRTFVFVNQVNEIGFRQTTALLIAAFVRQGCQVILSDITGLSIECLGGNSRICVTGIELPHDRQSSEHVAEYAAQHVPAECHEVGSDDMLVIRTNPGRDVARASLHHAFLDSATIAEAHGLRVFNSPAKLSFFANKASLALIDDAYRPEMIVSSAPAAICKFVTAAPSDCVVKPLVGSRGTNVIRVNKSTAGLEASLQSTFCESPMIAQRFVQANHTGDRRIVVLDGAILERDGHLAGIERHPATDDFRANLHAGGTAHPVTLSTKERAAVTHAAELLHAHGIRLAGVDLIGDQIIEFNVFSTGGLYDANRFASHNFANDIVDQIVAKSR